MSLVEQPATPGRLIELGEIMAAWGIKGWIKLYSWTRPIEQIFNYSHWLVGNGSSWQRIEIESTAQRANNGLVAKLAGVDDRDAAISLNGKTIAIYESELPGLNAGEYYWSQLIGLDVVDLDDAKLGTVSEMHETGANDVLVVKHQQGVDLIPYGAPVIHRVDLENGRIVVDWQRFE